jgi:predicted ATPase
MDDSKLRNREIPRIEYLRVQNYRALKNLELKDITPLTVFLGPNGSGKSTVFDVFAFLSECFTIGLRKAWDKRGRFKELRTRGCEGPIEFEIKYREKQNSSIITYVLKIEESIKGPYVASEKLSWRRSGSTGKPFAFLEFIEGKGKVITGEKPDITDEKIDESLDSPDMLAVNTLGQLSRNPRVIVLRRFITGWYLSYLTADQTRGVPEAGAQERLSATGNNLPNVMQYLKEQYPEQLKKILAILSHRVPKLDFKNVSLFNGIIRS